MRLHAIYVSRPNRRNAPNMNALCRSPPFTVGGWAWIYNSAATIRQGAKKGTDATVLETKLYFNWIGPLKILAVGPAPAFDIPDGRPLHDKLLCFDLPSDMRGRDSKHRVSVLQCKPCRNPDDIYDLPKHIPAYLTKYVLNSFSTTSPPFNVTVDDISPRRNARDRPDHGASTHSRPGRRHRRRVRTPVGRTPQPFVGTRTGSTAPPAPHPSLLVGHSFAAPPDQPLIPPDAGRGHTPRTIAVPERNRLRARLQTRPAQPLA